MEDTQQFSRGNYF